MSRGLGDVYKRQGQVFRHEFFYLESEREEIREQNAAQEQASANKS